MALISSNIFLKAVTANTIDLGNITGSLSTYEDLTSTVVDKWVDNTHAIKTNFKEAVDKIRGKKPYIAIFIDDLDRCSPDNVVKTIESIKNYFSLEGCHCVFIIGVDQDILKKGIHARYGTDLISGEEYLEKIINISFHIPRYGIEMTTRYINEIIRKATTPDWYEEIKEKVNNFSKLACGTGLRNPRRIKFLIYRYLFFISLKESEEYIEDIILRLIIWREFLPKIYKDKWKNGNISYLPALIYQDKGYDEIKDRYGDEYVTIAKSSELKLLLEFPEHIKALLVNIFDRKEPEITNAKDRLQRNDSIIYAKIQKYLDGNYKLKCIYYFNIVDLLFRFK